MRQYLSRDLHLNGPIFVIIIIVRFFQINVDGDPMIVNSGFKTLGVVGRKNGDIFGNIISFQWNWKAVVDYIICSSALYPFILSMKYGI